ncbi:MAG: hypothetical protein RTU09_06660 [Candidatus Thorarchaeota archaeon]
MGIPILSDMFSGLGVFLKTKRFAAYVTIFIITTFLGLFVSWLMTQFVGTPTEVILVNFFAYIGATGTIYFMIGTILTGLGLDKLWIKRRGRGKWNEMIGVSWFAISFAISVFMAVFFGNRLLIFFAMFCWVGWIAFQAYLSSRTSLRIATIAEPKKGGWGVTIGSFILLVIGLIIIAAEAIFALVLVPGNYFGIGDSVVAAFPLALDNITLHWPYLLLAFGLLGLFGVISILAYLKYARKGAALNVALLTVFIALYSAYFLFNVIRRTGASGLTPVDIGMSLFFLAYAMSGIGRTVTEAVEESRSRLRDLGPLLTFFLAGGFFFVDSIISVSTAAPTAILAGWFETDLIADPYAAFLFRDIAKLIAFPLVAIFTSLYYLRVQRVDRIIERAKEEGETFEAGEVDEEIAERAPAPGESWQSERAEGIPEGKPGHDLSGEQPGRLSVDRKTSRFTPGKRLGDDEEEED